jgi:hypothetical protein
LSGTGQLTKVCYLGTNQSVIDAIVANGKTVGCVSTPGPPIDLVATAGDGEISITFSAGADNGLAITNYEYSIDGNTYIPFDPVTTNSPLVITGLTSFTPYTIRLKAVNALGASAASSPATASPPTASPPTAFLKSLTKPSMNLKDGKYVCSVGTYVFGYVRDGVIDASTSGLVTPSKYLYNLLFNGAAQPALAATTANPTNSWIIPQLSSGTLISCSVTVTVNSLSTGDLSTENTDGFAAVQATQRIGINAAEATYKASVKAIPLAYQKALVDARAIWRKVTDAIRANYAVVLERIKTGAASKMISDVATAKEVTNAAKAKATEDYKASNVAALAAANKAREVAADAKAKAITKVNATYRAFIESIGYGVLVP